MRSLPYVSPRFESIRLRLRGPGQPLYFRISVPAWDWNVTCRGRLQLTSRIIILLVPQQGSVDSEWRVPLAISLHNRSRRCAHFVLGGHGQFRTSPQRETNQAETNHFSLCFVGSGKVIQVGKGVTRVKEGDSVLLSFSYCQKCKVRPRPIMSVLL